MLLLHGAVFMLSYKTRVALTYSAITLGMEAKNLTYPRTIPKNSFCLCLYCCGAHKCRGSGVRLPQKLLQSLMAHRVIIHHAQTHKHTHTQPPQRHFSIAMGEKRKTQYKWQPHATLWCCSPWLIGLIYFSSCVSQTTQTLLSFSLKFVDSKHKEQQPTFSKSNFNK